MCCGWTEVSPSARCSELVARFYSLRSALIGEMEAARPAAQDDGDRPEEPIRDAKARYAALDALLVDTGAALEYLPQVALTDDAAARIRLGNAVIIRGRDAPVEADEVCATVRGKVVAIGAIEAGMFKPRRVFTG